MEFGMVIDMSCQWCREVKRAGEKQNLGWTVIDDEMGQYVNNALIHFCFWCGRPLDVVGERKRNEDKVQG